MHSRISEFISHDLRQLNDREEIQKVGGQGDFYTCLAASLCWAARQNEPHWAKSLILEKLCGICASVCSVYLRVLCLYLPVMVIRMLTWAWRVGEGKSQCSFVIIPNFVFSVFLLWSLTFFTRFSVFLFCRDSILMIFSLFMVHLFKFLVQVRVLSFFTCIPIRAFHLLFLHLFLFIPFSLPLLFYHHYIHLYLWMTLVFPIQFSFSSTDTNFFFLISSLSVVIHKIFILFSQIIVLFFFITTFVPFP